MADSLDDIMACLKHGHRGRREDLAQMVPGGTGKLLCIKCYDLWLEAQLVAWGAELRKVTP